MKYEYELLEAFKPELLLVDRSKKAQEGSQSQKVFIDPVRLKKEGAAYL